ncbi:MAG: hypothetical protein LC799_22285, partial [Actinobacteria bacterium]|nr:hypothetical protein [Actinomycetota bacterium]
SRAIYFGLVFLAAELAMATGLILRGLRSGAARRSPEADAEVLARLRATRPAHPNRFEWLEPVVGRTNVFITMLAGGGLLLSAIAWLVDQLASRTSTPAGEVRLARQLARIGYPRGGLVVDDITVLAQAVPGCDDPQLRKLLRRAPRGG